MNSAEKHYNKSTKTDRLTGKKIGSIGKQKSKPQSKYIHSSATTPH
jgi:hypothetical protein